jgi:hypothetical protein
MRRFPDRKSCVSRGSDRTAESVTEEERGMYYGAKSGQSIESFLKSRYVRYGFRGCMIVS